MPGRECGLRPVSSHPTEDSMNHELNQKTVQSLAAKSAAPAGLATTVGLDAFVDEIIRVVDHRESVSQYRAMERIQQVGTRIIEASGQSTNLELVVDRIKLGGNGPIMANALAALGADVTCIGPLGENGIHPAFAEIAARANLVSLGPPAHTDALEFDDGKLMLGKLEPLSVIDWEHLRGAIGDELIGTYFASPSLLALVNWTMIPAMSAIWTELLRLFGTTGRAAGMFFFDLADPEKHTDKAVAAACKLLAKFQEFGPTVLGLNEKEAYRVGKCLGYDGGAYSRDDLHEVTAYISKTLPVETVVVHPRAYAVTASQGQITGDVDGPFTEVPKISTGAGDHFNAGFCLAKLLALPDDQALTVATGTSGYYVRNAESPTFAQLTEFLAQQQ